MSLEETIVALASAPGPGGRGVIRLSGPDSIAIVSALSDPSPAGRGRVDGQLRLDGLHSPLPASLLAMPGPASYTGQDCLEIHTISSPPLLDLLLSELIRLGARAARPGEFTMRAFLAGKKDLTQAEAVLAVIEADSDSELQQALTHLAGGMTAPLFALRDDLLNLLADVEAGLDFSEEDIQFVDKKEVLLRIGSGLAQLMNLRRQLDDRSVSGKTFRVALVGEPNAGKSSLFNALAGRADAIVSPVAGTTRDYLTRSVVLEGIDVELIDTAGRQTATDTIESQAQTLGRDQAKRADLRLVCIPAGEEIPSHDDGLIVVTKADLTAIDPDRLQTSAKSGFGIARLKNVLAEKAREARRPALASSLARCRGHVEKSLTHLRATHHTVLFDQPAELMALDLRLALEQIGEMVGAIHTDDLLDRIFSRFCIGK
jgi:tRNA modification GTPase